MKRPRSTIGTARDIQRQSKGKRSQKYASYCVLATSAILFLLTLQYRSLSQESLAVQEFGSQTGSQTSSRSLAEELQDPEDAPQVALMFLTRGVLPLERMWFEFFRTAAEIEPVHWSLLAANDASASAAQQERVTHKQALQAPTEDRRLQSSSYTNEVVQQGGKDDELPVQLDALYHPSRRKVAANERTYRRHMHGETAGTLAYQGISNKFLRLLLSAGSLAQKNLDVSAPQATGRASSDHLGSVLLGSTHVAQVQLGADIVVSAEVDGSSISHEDSAPSRISPRNPGGVIARQQLFSVYIHTAPHFAFRPSSIFAGYEIPDRVQVRWGQYTVAEAERRLIIEALKNPRNQRLVLLSESCAPLYPPQMVYAQLLSEQKSRVNACSEPELLEERWYSAMYRPGLLKPFHWRKSSQWKSLTREHAQMVADDTKIWPIFRRECYSYFLSDNVQMPPHLIPINQTSPIPNRNCVSDEHYVPTLLAVHHSDNETVCAPGSPTHTEWVEGLWSPKVHRRSEISRPFLAQLRQQGSRSGNCNVEAAVESTYGMFRRKGQATTLSGRVSQYKPLEDHCFLFARKFSPDTAPWLVVLGRDCVEGTGISVECLPQEPH